MRVVVCGAGVIGACTAYFLSRKGADVTVVERTGVAHAASGKSGGFLALDWCRGTALDPLARRSFALHAELAERLRRKLGLEWGYARRRTLAVAASERRDQRAAGDGAGPRWLGPNVAVAGALGTPETTAVIDPARFTRAMMRAAEAHGARLRMGAVEGIALTEEGTAATGAIVDGERLDADAVVLALGPWSISACRWLPLPPVYGLKGHSVVWRYAPDDPAALFVELEAADGAIEGPEVMPRADGTTYVCGLSVEEPVPEDPARVTAEPESLERLRELTRAFAPDLADAEVLATQACHRPITADALPLMGAVPGVEGAYVATGHNVWGMLNGPASGEAMAELLVDGAPARLDLSPFDPARLAPMRDEAP